MLVSKLCDEHSFTNILVRCQSYDIMKQNKAENELVWWLVWGEEEDCGDEVEM